MKKHLTIENCEDCPFFITAWAQNCRESCKKVGKPIPYEPEDNGYPIPGFCPLPDEDSQTTDKKTLLIRDQSSISTEAEKYLQETKTEYDVIFSEGDNLPCIIPPHSTAAFNGERGFKLYKALQNDRSPL